MDSMQPSSDILHTDAITGFRAGISADLVNLMRRYISHAVTC
jgi:hypothetical protein